MKEVKHCPDFGQDIEGGYGDEFSLFKE